MPKKIIDYSNTIIYKIYCKDECITDIYVGHTTNFIQRKSAHKAACNNQNNDFKIYKIIRENGGWTNWDMIEIAKYNCKDSTEARIKENEHYNQLKATLNSCPPYVDKKNYFCSKCNLQCSNPKQYETHLKCVKHNNLKEDNINNRQHNVSQLIANKYNCNLCHYTTCNQCDFNKHNLTRKHVKNINETQLKQNETMLPEKSVTLLCNCGLVLNNRITMWRHKKKCTKQTSMEGCSDINVLKENQPANLITNELVMELIKDNKEMKQLIIELIKNGITNNSNIHNKCI